MASIIFMGTPEFAVPSLKALLEAGHDVTLVVTRPDRPKGRGHAVSPPPVKEFALSQGIRVIQPARLKGVEFIGGLKAVNPDFIVVVAYGRILPKAALEVPKIAPVNVHASLLPRYRGASPIAWAIINGDKETGVTTMIISEGLDEGDILLSKKAGILEGDTTESLGRKLSILGASLLVKTIEGMIEGKIKRIPQTGEATYAPQLKKEDGRVDWTMTAGEIFNFVRGMHPWPGAYSKIDDETIKLLKVVASEGAASPGVVHAVTKEAIVVGTGGGLISVLEVKPEGKKAMAARAYLQGRNIKEGMVFK